MTWPGPGPGAARTPTYCSWSRTSAASRARAQVSCNCAWTSLRAPSCSRRQLSTTARSSCSCDTRPRMASTSSQRCSGRGSRCSRLVRGWGMTTRAGFPHPRFHLRRQTAASSPGLGGPVSTLEPPRPGPLPASPVVCAADTLSPSCAHLCAPLHPSHDASWPCYPVTRPGCCSPLMLGICLHSVSFSAHPLPQLSTYFVQLDGKLLHLGFKPVGVGQLQGITGGAGAAVPAGDGRGHLSLGPKQPTAGSERTRISTRSMWRFRGLSFYQDCLLERSQL